MSSSIGGPGPGSKRTFGVGYLIVFAIVIAALLGGAYFGLFFPRPSPPDDGLVFSTVGIDAAHNASWVVNSVVGGPYPSAGFSIRLEVNGSSMNWVPLPRNDTVSIIAVGSTSYRILWSDTDGDGAVSQGDRFFVNGEEAALPSFTTFEFNLKWMESWIAKAPWTTTESPGYVSLALPLGVDVSD